MSNINIEQKINDYSTEIELLEKKKALLEAGKDTVEVDRQLEIFRTSVTIREKTKLKEALIPILQDSNAQLELELKVANEQMDEGLTRLMEVINDMSEEDTRQLLAIKKLNKDNAWQAPQHKIQAFQVVVNLFQKYAKLPTTN
jgi:hypothetical protein